MFATVSRRRCYAMKVLKKIFAVLAGALALITVPPTGEAERQLPIILDLSSHQAQPPHAPQPAVMPSQIAFVWPLSPQ
jgi:hypothetical protein